MQSFFILILYSEVLLNYLSNCLLILLVYLWVHWIFYAPASGSSKKQTAHGIVYTRDLLEGIPERDNGEGLGGAWESQLTTIQVTSS